MFVRTVAGLILLSSLSLVFPAGARAEDCLAQSEFDAILGEPVASEVKPKTKFTAPIFKITSQLVGRVAGAIDDLSCPSYNLTPRFSQLNKKGFRDQGTAPLCYAYAIADVFSYEKERAYSALSFAITRAFRAHGQNLILFPDLMRLNSLEGAGTAETLTALNDGAHVCTEAELPSDSDRGPGKVPTEEIVSRIENFWIAVRHHDLAGACATKVNIDNLFLPLQQIPKEQRMAEFTKMAARAANPIAFLYGLNQRACRPVSAQKMTVNLFRSLSPDQSAFSTAAALTSLRDGRPLIVSLTPSYMHRFTNGNQGHMLVIAQSRVFNHQCEFLVRNSWGPYGSCLSTEPDHCLYGATWMPGRDLEDPGVAMEVATLIPD